MALTPVAGPCWSRGRAPVAHPFPSRGGHLRPVPVGVRAGAYSPSLLESGRAPMARPHLSQGGRPWLIPVRVGVGAHGLSPPVKDGVSA